MHGHSITRSNLRKVRRHGFRARMKSRFGRKVLSRRRAMGRRLLPDV